MGLGKERFLTLVLTIAVLSAVSYLACATAASAQESTHYDPSLRVVPDQGPPGTEVSLFGTGYPPSSHILIKIDWASGTFEEDTNAAGLFSFDTSVPDVKPGTYDIRAGNIKTTYNPDAEFRTSTIYIMAHSSFTVTGKGIPAPTPKPGVTRTAPPNPPPPLPPVPTNSATSGGTSQYDFTIAPTSGPPGTVVSVTGSGFEGPILAVFVGGTRLDSGTIRESAGGSISGSVTVPASAQPGPLTISVESSKFTGIATFMVTGKKVMPSTTVNTAGQSTNQNTNPPPQSNGTKAGQGTSAGQTPTSGTGYGTPPPPPPPEPPGTGSEGGSGGEEGGTGGGETNTGTEDQGGSGQGGPGTDSGTGPEAGANPPAGPSSYPVTWRPAGKPESSGATFRIIKTVEGGDALPSSFSFTITLTGPDGSAQYSPHMNRGETSGRDYQSAVSDFNLDLPEGNTLSAGSYQVTETNPGDYTPEYSRGCSGTYGNDGYMYWCFVTNVKAGEISEDTVGANTLPTPLPPEPGKTVTTTPVTSTAGASSKGTTTPIPSWVKNNAKWWTEGTIDDKTFVQAMQYISGGTSATATKGIQSQSSGSQQVPAWVKNTVKWWVNGQVSDDEFKSAVKYMLQTKIVAGAGQ